MALCEFWDFYLVCQISKKVLTLNLLNMINPTFANSVHPDLMAVEEAIWSLFVMQLVNWMNRLYQVIWLVDSQEWVWLNYLSSRIRVRTFFLCPQLWRSWRSILLLGHWSVCAYETTFRGQKIWTFCHLSSHSWVHMGFIP